MDITFFFFSKKCSYNFLNLHSTNECKVVFKSDASRRLFRVINVEHTKTLYPQEECIYEGIYTARGDFLRQILSWMIFPGFLVQYFLTSFSI